MAPGRGDLWERIERLYWASALGLGAVALLLEALLRAPLLLAFGGLYLAVSLLLAQRGRGAIGVHLAYAVLSTLALLWLVPEVPLAGRPLPLLAAVLVLAVLALGVYGGPWPAALAALAAALGAPGLGPYARIGFLGVYALAGYLGVRIRGWLAELAATQERLAWIAHHDPLTGLENRRALEAAYAAHPRPGYLSLWDVDDLKRINDARGHAAGDAALRALAEAFRAEARREDRFFRTGGDEFVGLHVGSAPPIGLIERVRRRFPGVSVGWAVLGDGGLEAAVAAADRAMYQAKRKRAESR